MNEINELIWENMIEIGKEEKGGMHSLQESLVYCPFCGRCLWPVQALGSAREKGVGGGKKG